MWRFHAEDVADVEPLSTEDLGRELQLQPPQEQQGVPLRRDQQERARAKFNEPGEIKQPTGDRDNSVNFNSYQQHETAAWRAKLHAHMAELERCGDLSDLDPAGGAAQKRSREEEEAKKLAQQARAKQQAQQKALAAQEEDEEQSEYEKKRAENLLRNAEILKLLGLE